MWGSVNKMIKACCFVERTECQRRAAAETCQGRCQSTNAKGNLINLASHKALLSIHWQHLPPNVHPRTSLQTLFCTGLHISFGVCFFFFFGAFLNYNCLFYSWHSALFQQTNRPLLNNHILADQTFTALTTRRIVLLWFSLILPRRVVVDMSEVQQTSQSAGGGNQSSHPRAAAGAGRPHPLLW